MILPYPEKLPNTKSFSFMTVKELQYRNYNSQSDRVLKAG